MIFARFLGALLLGYLLHLLGVTVAARFSMAFAPLLVVLVWFAMRVSPLAAQLLGAVTGLVEDALTGGLFGLHAFADTLVAYGVALASQRVVVGQQAVRVLLFAGAALLQQLVVMGLLTAMVDEPPLPAAGFVLLKVLTTAVLGAVLISLESRARSQFSAWQRRRSRQLRFR